MKKKHTYTTAILVVLVSIFSLLDTGCQRDPKTMIIDGNIDCDEINVSSKVPGRIKQLLVDEGTSVKVGDPVVVLESNEIDAKVDAASAAYQSTEARVAQAGTAVKFQRAAFSDQLDEAQAQYDARKEDVRQAEENLNAAKSNFTTQEDSYNRFHGLFADGVVPRQVEEQYENGYSAAKAQFGAAESKVDQAKAGLKAAAAALQLAKDESLQVTLREQERSAIQQQADAAQGEMHEALALQGETRIAAPVAGYVSEKISNTGEMVAPGFPMVTISRANDFKVKVYVDESKFGYLQIGRQIKVILPAFGNKVVYGRLIRINQAADFATKKATNEQGTLDVRGLQLVIKLDDDPRYRNGMTARVELDESEK
ncbi:MAG: HlyD family secretion protein [Acidobacteriaceae bacterium]